MPKLQLTRPDGSQVDHELTEEKVTVGRASDTVFQIDDPSVSSHHAEITSSQEGCILKDLGSTNGTKVNGKPLEPQTGHALKPGDRIRFGKVDAVFDPDHADAGAHQLPLDEERVLTPAAQSVKPSNFMNASPFQKRMARKDPMHAAAMILGTVAILVSLVVLLMAMQMKAT